MLEKHIPLQQSTTNMFRCSHAKYGSTSILLSVWSICFFFFFEYTQIMQHSSWSQSMQVWTVCNVRGAVCPMSISVWIIMKASDKSESPNNKKLFTGMLQLMKVSHRIVYVHVKILDEILTFGRPSTMLMLLFDVAWFDDFLSPAASFYSSKQE